MIATAPRAVRIGPTGLPPLTLGWHALGWSAEFLEQPDGPTAGQPWTATDEQARFILWWYAIDESGRFVYRSGVLRRMKGWGKDPLASVLCAVEFVGPCRFDGWDRNGAPKAKAHPAAWVQIAAVSKEQTRNTMVLFPGLLSKRAQSEYGIDLGKEIIYAHGGRCRLEAVTSSPRALEGGRGTHILQNETQHWLASSEGHAMAEVIARNAGKSRDGSSRVLSITNAHRIGEDSVAEREWNAFQKMGAAGDILYDSIEADPDTDLDDDASLRAGIEAARGDSVWLDVERIVKEIRDPRTSESQARRFYLNQLRAEKSGWIAAAAWEACERVEDVPAGAFITLGFDGSRFRDATAIVGTVIATGYQWVLGVWERDELDEAWEVPRDEVKAVIAEAFSRYAVWRAYCDPYWWEETIAEWSAAYGEERVVFWRTNLLGRMARLVKTYETAVKTLEVGHEADERFARHVANCVKHVIGIRDEDGERMYVVSKEGASSPNKIDIAVTAMLSWQARLDAIASGAEPPGDQWTAADGLLLLGRR